MWWSREMLELIGFAVLGGAVAALVTSLVVPLVSRVAVSLRAVDSPGGRRMHQGVVPRLGGVAIGLGLALGPGAVAMARWPMWGDRIGRSDLVAFMLGTGIVFLVGLVDDVMGLPVWKKLLGQVAAATLIVLAGWEFRLLFIPGLGDVHLGELGSILSVIWIVGLTNAINLVDGLDGLAGGVVAIIAASLSVYSLLQQNYFSVVLLAGVTGACLGFLWHNWRGTIFLGDAGSLSLGYVLAVISVHGSTKSSAAVAVLVPVLALGVPAMDTLLVMLVRFLERPRSRVGDRFLAMFRADRNHLHHLLQEWARDRRHVVWGMYALVLAGCTSALVVAVKKSWAVGMALTVVELLAVVAVRRLGLSARLRAATLEERQRIRERIQQGEEPLPENEG